MSRVAIDMLNKVYTPGDVHAVRDVSLTVKTGELLCLLGPSGCGKTTVLKMIAGLERPTDGDVRFDDESVVATKAEKREAVMVFQDHLLFPYMTVGENVAFGLRMRRISESAVGDRVQRMLEMVQLTGMADRSPSQLSGGQRQRVALARALIIEPKVLLLDEPLSNLDASLRDEMRELICRLQRELSVTTIFVTHSQNEAVQLADRIALMFRGRLIQIGSARDFYDRPVQPEVAAFFGNRNVFEGRKQGTSVSTPIGRLPLTDEHTEADGPVHVYIRPEAIEVGTDEERSSRLPPIGETAVVLRGELSACAYLGTYTRYRVRIGDVEIEARGAPTRGCIETGTAVSLTIPSSRIWLTEAGTA